MNDRRKTTVTLSIALLLHETEKRGQRGKEEGGKRVSSEKKKVQEKLQRQIT